MGKIRDAFNLAFPDGPSSAPSNPVKSQIRPIGTLIETEISGAAAGAVQASSLAELNAYAAERTMQVGQQGFVTQGEDKGTYSWNGSAFERVGDYIDQALVEETAEAVGIAANRIDQSLAVGDLFSRAAPTGQVQNGATAIIVGMGQRMVGFTIPQGSSGQNSFVSIPLPLTKEDILALKGKTIEVVATATASPNFEELHPLAQTAVTVLRAGVATQAGTFVSSAQEGNTLTRIARYTVDGTEDVIAPAFTVSGAQTAGVGVELRVNGLTVRVVEDMEGSALGIGATSKVARSDNASEPVSIAIELSDLSLAGEEFNGAHIIEDDAGRATGILIPAGQQGDDTYINAEWTPDNNELLSLRGAKVRLYMDFDISADFTAKIDAHLKYVTPTSSAAPDDEVVLVNKVVRPGLYRVVIEGTLPVDLTKVRGTFQVDPFGQGGAPSSDQSIVLKSISYRHLVPFGGIVGVNSGGYKETPADINDKLNRSLTLRRARRLAAAGTTTQAAAIDEFIVVPDVYSTVANAVNDLSDAGEMKRYQVSIGPGIYDGEDWTDWSARSQIAVAGLNGEVTINAALAADATLTDIENKAAFNATVETRISGLRVTAENLRYVLHCDFQFASSNQKLLVEDCELVHLGNDAARAHQSSIGEDPDAVWGGTAAIGFGPKDGGEQVFRRVLAQGYKFHAAVGHSYIAAKSPTKLVVEQSRFLAGEGDFASLLWRQVGSGQLDVIETVGNVFNAPLMLSAWPWLPTAPEMQVANKTRLVWTGHSNTPTPYVWDDEGSRALRIDATTDNVGITLSGSAVAVLFGEIVPVRPALGLPGGVYGTWDVGDHNPGTADSSPNMSERLGDRSSSPLTLTVTPSIGSPVTVTLNQNFTGQSNAAILSTINAALGGVAVASYFDVNDLFRPIFTDEEITVRNTGSTTIRRKMAVAFDDGPGFGRIMMQADAAHLFAGIAYEDIRPGECGRVKSGGMVRVAQDILRSDSGTFAQGDYFGVGAIAGRFVVNPAIPLMRAVNDRDVLVGERVTEDSYRQYSPTIGSTGGAAPTSATATVRYRRSGGHIAFSGSVAVTSIGSASGYITMTLPPGVSMAASPVLVPMSAFNGNSDSSVKGFLLGGTIRVPVPGADGQTVYFSGAFEAA